MTGRRLLHPLLTAALALFAQAAAAVYPPPAQGRHGMVVASQHLAAEVGRQVLEEGGNAVDAAVAMGYALAVVDPCCGNIGGGGFMTLHLADGRNTFIDFREKAPQAATRDMYLDARGDVVPGRSTRGWLAVGVPGTVMGLETARKRYGTMSRARLMAPAIRLAEQGFVLERGDTRILHYGTKAFAARPQIAAVFLNHGKPWRPGQRLMQKHLAATLKRIAREGTDGFYKGPVARAIAAASKAGGGLITMADLADYTAPERKPVTCDYRGYHVISAPPPSSGGTTLCLILNVLAGYPMGWLGFHSAEGVHYTVEAMRHAYADRNFLLGDPDFVHNPLSRLLSPRYAARIRAHIARYAATPSSTLSPGTPAHEAKNTTHFSVVDDKGNAVAVTYTINGYFGARVMAGATGFFLNNEMDDFTAKPGVPNQYGLVQGARNAIAPGKRPLSSMTPTIVTRDGKLFMVLGSPGGSRIITITLETFMNVVDYGMDVQAAVDAPRFHHQWLPDVVQAEPFAFSADTREKLEHMGYTIRTHAPWGAAEAIVVDPATGIIYGGTDHRQPAGAALGY